MQFHAIRHQRVILHLVQLPAEFHSVGNCTLPVADIVCTVKWIDIVYDTEQANTLGYAALFIKPLYTLHSVRPSVRPSLTVHSLREA